MENKECPVCRTMIDARAKVCPACHKPPQKYALILFHPLAPITFSLVYTGILFAVLFWLQSWMNPQRLAFRDYSDQFSTRDVSFEFGEHREDPVINVVGYLKNDSDINWNDLKFEVRFFDNEGKLVDAGQKVDHDLGGGDYLPAHDEIAFDVRLVRMLSEENYASCQARLLHADEADVGWLNW